MRVYSRDHPHEVVPSRPRPPVVLPAVIAAEGAALAVLAGLDGSAAWQAARVVVAVVVTVWAVWFIRRARGAGRGATVLLVGIAGTAAGAGVGSAHLAKAGAGSTRTSVLGQAAVLARHGYGALLVDTRGHGRSGGRAMDFGWWGNQDLAAAVSFMGRQPGVQAGKIAVLGESMGGEQALAAAGSDPRIRAVVAEGATGQQLADHGWLPGGLLSAPLIAAVSHGGCRRCRWRRRSGAGQWR
ncbi:MAG: alpha/beta hydrolase [Streptosporangiaceae bacterium]